MEDFDKFKKLSADELFYSDDEEAEAARAAESSAPAQPSKSAAPGDSSEPAESAEPNTPAAPESVDSGAEPYDYFGMDDLYSSADSNDCGDSAAEPSDEVSADSSADEHDEFVIGGGFQLDEDYEGQARSRKGRDEKPVIKQYPLSERDTVDLHRLNRAEKRAQKKNQKPRHGIKTIIWIAAILVSACLIAAGILTAFSELLGVGKSGICVVIIKEGMTTTEIADTLEKENAIDHPLLFRAYLKLKKQDGTLRHGAYQFDSSIGYDGIIELLQKGNEKESVKVRIPEAATIRSIMQILEENNVCTQEQFKTAMVKGTYDYDFVKAIPNDKVYYRLEGYLYPDTYDFFTGESQANAEFAIDRMLANFEKHLKESCPDYKEQLKDLNKYGITSLNDALSLASIVQLECNGFPDQMSNVSAVFLGRLVWSEPKYLGSTPTFYYPDNRYNTNNYALYENGKKVSDAGYEGLPPGPQCSVTVQALKAVLRPNEDYIGKYYYFVTDANSKFYFNATYKEHQATIKKLQRQGLWKG